MGKKGIDRSAGMIIPVSYENYSELRPLNCGLDVNDLAITNGKQIGCWMIFL